MIVSGVVAYEFARKRILPLITYIQGDPFLNAQIDQIHVGGNGNLTMGSPGWGTTDLLRFAGGLSGEV